MTTLILIANIERLFYFDVMRVYIFTFLFAFLSISFPIQSESYFTQILNFQQKSESYHLQPIDHNHTWWITETPINPKEFHLTEQITNENFPGWRAVKPGSNPIKENLIPKDAKEFWYLKTFRYEGIPPKNLAIYLGEISDRDETYLNGQKISSTGIWESPFPQAYGITRIYEIPIQLLKEKQTNYLLIKVKKYFAYTAGLYSSNIFMGNLGDLKKSFYLNNILQPLSFLICYATVGSYFLFLFLMRRKERENFFFGIFVFDLIFYLFLRNEIRFELNLSFFIFKKMEFAALCFPVPLIYLFIHSYFRTYLQSKKIRIWHHILLSTSGFLQLGFSFFFLCSSNVVLWDWLVNTILIPILWPPFLITGIAFLVYASYKKNRDALFMLIGLTFVFAGMVHDSIVNMDYWNHPRITGYVFFIFILTLAFILAKRFVRVHQEVETLNATLEEKVENRTKELRETLNVVQTLKQKQDGDYFLTSLLINPLIVNNITEVPNISIEFLIKQKKDFDFKGRKHELGGDICIAHSFLLKKRKYILIANADAMGKSIQGAGGALILGSILESIVVRTTSREESSDVFPEKWLYNTFFELHRVFEIFKCSMLVSIVFGLLDEENGLLYFINAEHPFPVLFRDEKASFVETPEFVRKLGTPDMENINVNIFQMENDDCLFLASDGRDDIFIKKEKSMNADDTLFLKCIEKSKGELELILENLKEEGEITDDLSILKLKYTKKENIPLPIKTKILKNFKFALKEKKRKNIKLAIIFLEKIRSAIPNHPKILKYLIELYTESNKYLEAASVSEFYSLVFPKDEKYICFASLYYGYAGNHSKAIENAERLFFRNPNNSDYKKFLAGAYNRAEERKKAEWILKS